MAGSVNDRIERFKKMADADPDNELGHFSLGKAYLEVGQFKEAAASLCRTIELNPAHSKAYQLLSDAYHKAGDRTKAVETLKRGVSIAEKQGDRMPGEAMIALLIELGESPPSTQAAQGQGSPGQRIHAGSDSGSFRCTRCGNPTGKLEKPPFKGPLGVRIQGNVCHSCWREWVSMGTKVINELGLSLRDSSAQEIYDQHMIEFLQLEDN